MYLNRLGFYDQELIDIYKHLLLPRLIEEKMLVLYRQGKVSKWFSGLGQEAISVGATLAMEPNEWIMPQHRNLGVFTTRHLPLHKLFIQWQGGKDGYSKGRERSFHFGSPEYHICGMISHLGATLSVADGVALANNLKKQTKASLAFIGDGGTSEGDFHEALNVAAVWGLPVIFAIENNGYALSTTTKDQFRCEDLIDKAKGYGIESAYVDGNNILQVYDAIKGVREACLRDGKPYLVEFRTFRMGGHEESSIDKNIPKELVEEWALKDPITNFEAFLVKEQALTENQIAQIRTEIQRYIDSEWAIADKPKAFVYSVSEEVNDVYAEMHSGKEDWPIISSEKQLEGKPSTPTRFLDAIKQALQQSLKKHPNLVLMGQDIGAYGGVFKVTEGLQTEFGKNRVRDTPLCESAIIGTALGLSLEGYKSVVEMQFADFVSEGFSQIVNNLAKIHYRWGQKAEVVIRMPTGAGLGAGPFHSQSNEAWFTHVPGLKVVYPSSAFDAKGLLVAAINDPNPVLFFEHKALYRSISGNVPNEYYEVEIGKANLVNNGDDITIITYGAGVHWALEYQKQHPETSMNILDLRTLLPLDYTSISYAVEKTGRVLVLHEDTLIGGIGGEIAAWIGEHCFSMLDAPVLRCASLDTPVPFNTELEKQFLAKSRLHESITKLLSF